MPSLVDAPRQAELVQQAKTGFADALSVTGRIADRLDAALRSCVQTTARETEKVLAKVIQLLEKNAQGEAVELVKTAARQFQENGDEQASVEIHCSLARQLLTRGNAG